MTKIKEVVIIEEMDPIKRMIKHMRLKLRNSKLFNRKPQSRKDD